MRDCGWKRSAGQARNVRSSLQWGRAQLSAEMRIWGNVEGGSVLGRHAINLKLAEPTTESFVELPLHEQFCSPIQPGDAIVIALLVGPALRVSEHFTERGRDPLAFAVFFLCHALPMFHQPLKLLEARPF